MVVQWLGLHASTAGGVGSIPGGGAKVLFTVKCSPTLKKKKNIYIYNKNKYSGWKAEEKQRP